MTSLAEIERLAKNYADAHEALAEKVRDLNEALEREKRARLRYIKSALGPAAAAKGDLAAAVDGARDLFIRPRTVIFHGIKVGLQAGKQTVNFEDADAVVDRAERLFADMAATLINTKKSPNKTAIAMLTAPELKKLGCTLSEPRDEIVIKPTDGEVEKVVAALLKDAESDLEEKSVPSVSSDLPGDTRT